MRKAVELGHNVVFSLVTFARGTENPSAPPQAILSQITMVFCVFRAGVYNLCQALCYAELGTVIPRAGGDYAYLYEILGPVFGFMTAWIHIVIIGACVDGDV